MPGMSMVQALNSAMDVMLARNPDVVIFGEDVGFYGGVFRVTEGRQKKDGDPVVFFEPKRLYNGPFDGHPDRPSVPWTQHPQSEVPEGYYSVPLGKAAVVRPGDAVTVLAYGTMVHVALAAAEEAGIDAEVIDLRTLLPLDIDTVVDSVKKTGRCVIAHEATRTCGYGAELAALVQEHCFYHLEAPIVRVTGWDTPYPHIFEWEYFPGPQRVADGMRRALERDSDRPPPAAGHARPPAPVAALQRPH